MLAANTELRARLKAESVPLWLIADQLKIHESTLIRHLRHELPEQEKQRILSALQEIRTTRA